MVEFYNDNILYNKPIYVGCSMLELSMFTMLKLDYDVIKMILCCYYYYDAIVIL